MLGKRFFELSCMEKKLARPNQELGCHIVFWRIARNATGCQPGIFFWRPFGTQITKNLVGVVFRGGNFFKGPASAQKEKRSDKITL